jgi:hypothetical protein
MRCSDLMISWRDRHFDGVRTPSTSRGWLSMSKHGYANQAIGSASLATEAPLTG